MLSEVCCACSACKALRPNVLSAATSAGLTAVFSDFALATAAGRDVGAFTLLSAATPPPPPHPARAAAATSTALAMPRTLQSRFCNSMIVLPMSRRDPRAGPQLRAVADLYKGVARLYVLPRTVVAPLPIQF